MGNVEMFMLYTCLFKTEYSPVPSLVLVIRILLFMYDTKIKISCADAGWIAP